MHFIDTHAHLLPQYYSDEVIEHTIRTAPDHQICRLINVGFDKDSATFSSQLSAQHPQVYAAIGLHPHDANTFSDDLLDHFEALLEQYSKIVAIGEIGLDYYYLHSPKARQIEVFKILLRFAQHKKLPVIVHIRDAWDDLISIVNQEDLPLANMVFHCYGGDENVSRFLMERGAYISLTGTITFKKYDPAPILNFPLDKIMLETDCPYLTPHPLRGKTNSPENIPFIAQKLATIKSVPIEIIAEKTTQNANIFFHLN